MSYIVAIDMGTTQLKASLFRKEEDELRFVDVAFDESESFEKGRIKDKSKLAIDLDRLLNSLFLTPELPNGIKRQNADVRYCIGVSGMTFRMKTETYDGNLDGQVFSEIEMSGFMKLVKDRYAGAESNKNLVRVKPIKYEFEEAKSKVTRITYSVPLDCALNKIKIHYLLTYVDSDFVKDMKTILACDDSNITFYPIASAKAKYLCKEATLKRTDGFVLIDIGGGTTSVAAFKSGVLLGEYSFPFGADTVTYDIMRYVNIDNRRAKNIKFNLPLILEYKNYKLTIGGKEIKTDAERLKEVVQLRLEEIISHVCAFCAKVYGTIDVHTMFGVTGGGSFIFSVEDVVKGLTDAEVKLFQESENKCSGDISGAIVDSSEIQYSMSGTFGMVKLYREEFAEQFVKEHIQDMFDEPKEKSAKESKSGGIVKGMKSFFDNMIKPSEDIGDNF